MECADFSALWKAATCRRSAHNHGFFIWPRQVAAYESGNKLPHSKVGAFQSRQRYFAPNDATGELSRIPEYGEEMARSSGEDEQVPGEVRITNAVRGIKADPGGVGDAPRRDPYETRKGHGSDDLRRRDYYQPTHR